MFFIGYLFVKLLFCNLNIICSNTDNKKNNEGNGEILYCTLIDYRNGSKTEYIGEINNTTLKTGNTALVKIKLSSSALNDNKGTDYCGFDATVSGKTINIFVNAKKDANMEIELLNKKGDLIAPIFNNKITKGSFTKCYDAKSISEGKYILRAITNDQVICKTVEIK